ncbi:MAG: MerR family transcriptional regulator [Candidatus Gastranaerophilales bacterium]|nr:MerR family transcriptional regulator [Candidatus Gastranaerophilales bacterium]
MKIIEEEKLYTVQEVAKMYNISKHTIRYYTDMGLIPPLKRDKNNNRLFDRESLNWLEGCICLKGCGMSIKDLKRYEELCLQGKSTLQERYEMIVKYRNLAKEKYLNAKKVLDYAEHKVKHYEDIILGKTYDNSNPTNWNKSELDCK